MFENLRKVNFVNPTKISMFGNIYANYFDLAILKCIHVSNHEAIYNYYKYIS